RKLGGKKTLELVDRHCYRHRRPPLRQQRSLDGAKRNARTIRVPIRPRITVSSLPGLAELLAQLVLRPHQGPLAGRGQVLAGAVDVEGQHRERGTVRIALAPTAPFGGAFQRRRDPFRVAHREDALLEGERVALLGDPTRPAPSAARLRRPPGCGALAASSAMAVAAAWALGCCACHDAASRSGPLRASTLRRRRSSCSPLNRSSRALSVKRFREPSE